MEKRSSSVRNISLTPFFVGIFLLCAGCTVRSTAEKQSEPKKPGDAAKSVPIDKENVHLAEVKIPLERLGSALRVFSKYDAHMVWQEEFVRETVTDAKWLENGQRLEGQMVASDGDASYQLEIVILRVSEREFAVRVLSTDPAFSKKLGSDLEKI